MLEAGPHPSNSGNFMVNFAEENGNNAPHKLVLINNTLVDDYTAPGKVNVAVTADTSGWSGNVYAGPGGAPTLVNASGAASFTNYATRASAGLPAYDMTTASLPTPPRCP